MRFKWKMALNAILLICFSIFATQDQWRVPSANATQSGHPGNNGTAQLNSEETAQPPSVDHPSEGGKHLSDTVAFLLITCYVICVVNLAMECLQLQRYIRDAGLRGLAYQFKSPWNLVKIGSGVCMLIFFKDAVSSLKKADVSEELVAIQCILLWMTVLYYAQPFRLTGPLVSTLRVIMRDILPFLILGLMVMTGFSFAIHGLFNGERLNNLPDTFETMFYALLGNFETEIFEDSSQDDIRTERAIVFDSFLVLEGIVLVSLLVAIMSDSYDKVKLMEKAFFIRCRAMIIDDCEATLLDCSVKRLEGRTGRYVHALMPVETHSSDRDSVWQGKIVALERSARRLINDHEVKASKDREETKKDVENVKRSLQQVTGMTQELKSQTEGMRAAIAKQMTEFGSKQQTLQDHGTQVAQSLAQNKIELKSHAAIIESALAQMKEEFESQRRAMQVLQAQSDRMQARGERMESVLEEIQQRLAPEPDLPSA